MARQFERLLRAALAAPSQALHTLVLLSPAEQQQLLWEWNATPSGSRQPQAAHEQVAAQAARHPQRVALVFEQQHLSYQALEHWSSQLACYLREQGVAPEVRVGVCLARGPRLVLTLLAVLKAGGVYVPLSPHDPIERLGYLLADTAAALLVSEAALRERLPASSARVLELEQVWSALATAAPAPGAQTPPVAATQLAYIIYTSGSTGRPKGVLLEHGGLSNLVYEMATLVCGSSRVLQFAAQTFDASLLQIFMALGGGATLVLARRSSLLPGAPLLELLEQQAISHLNIPPSALAVLPSAALARLQLLIAGVDAYPIHRSAPDPSRSPLYPQHRRYG